MIVHFLNNITYAKYVFYMFGGFSKKIQLSVGDTVRKMSDDVSGITYLSSQQPSARVISREKDLIAPQARSSVIENIYLV